MWKGGRSKTVKLDSDMEEIKKMVGQEKNPSKRKRIETQKVTRTITAAMSTELGKGI